ncbi:MAG: hypothetical protein V9E96_03150 [Chitinophagaceae bacterium]
MTIAHERRASGRTAEALALIEEAVDLLNTATGRLTAADPTGLTGSSRERVRALSAEALDSGFPVTSPHRREREAFASRLTDDPVH